MSLQFVILLFILLFIAGFAFVLQRHRAKPIPIGCAHPKGAFFTNPIITQIGRENNISAENYVSRTVGDADPYNLVNLLMRTSLKRSSFISVF